MKCSDIDDQHVIDLARQWHEDPPPWRGPGVVAALMTEGIPEKLARTKVERLVKRGFLDYGTSPYHSWPTGKRLRSKEVGHHEVSPPQG